MGFYSKYSIWLLYFRCVSVICCATSTSLCIKRPHKYLGCTYVFGKLGKLNWSGIDCIDFWYKQTDTVINSTRQLVWFIINASQALHHHQKFSCKSRANKILIKCYTFSVLIIKLHGRMLFLSLNNIQPCSSKQLLSPIHNFSSE